MRTKCPNCGKAFEAKEEAIGRRVRCPSCWHVFRVQARSPEPLPVDESSPQGASEEAEPEPPTPEEILQAYKESRYKAGEARVQVPELVTGAPAELLGEEQPRPDASAETEQQPKSHREETEVEDLDAEEILAANRETTESPEEATGTGERIEPTVGGAISPRRPMGLVFVVLYSILGGLALIVLGYIFAIGGG
ncbi:MAG: hypothetical protein KAX19_00430, partial [Candidatus Brocadiae bacterium]|nr:hypothetical protein [Candidatus Brocadiia bacterium]